VGEPVVERFQRGPFVVELAERDSRPGAVGSVVDEVVDLEVEQLADAQPGVAQHGDANACEAVVEVGDRGHDGGVDLGWERTG
jgi:hypothetical protein